MKNILKSTTNTITLFVVIGTFIIVMYALIMGIETINTLVFGAWTTLIGWVVGAKSSKTKHEETEQPKDDTINELQKVLLGLEQK